MIAKCWIRIGDDNSDKKVKIKTHLEKALKLIEKIMEPTHPEILWILWNIGINCFKLRNYS